MIPASRCITPFSSYIVLSCVPLNLHVPICRPIDERNLFVLRDDRFVFVGRVTLATSVLGSTAVNLERCKPENEWTI